MNLEVTKKISEGSKYVFVCAWVGGEWRTKNSSPSQHNWAWPGVRAFIKCLMYCVFHLWGLSLLVIPLPLTLDSFRLHSARRWWMIMSGSSCIASHSLHVTPHTLFPCHICKSPIKWNMSWMHISYCNIHTVLKKKIQNGMNCATSQRGRSSTAAGCFCLFTLPGLLYHWRKHLIWFRALLSYSSVAKPMFMCRKSPDQNPAISM